MDEAATSAMQALTALAKASQQLEDTRSVAVRTPPLAKPMSPLHAAS